LELGYKIIYLLSLLAAVLASFMPASVDGGQGNGEVLMRIQFKIEGGIAYFPGLSQPLTLDSAQLSQNDAAELKRLIDQTQFFDLPEQVGTPPRGAADYYIYTVTIEEDGRSHTVRMTDFVQEPKLKELLNLLKRLSRQSKP
jgi:hypothetical protein